MSQPKGKKRLMTGYAIVCQDRMEIQQKLLILPRDDSLRKMGGNAINCAIDPENMWTTLKQPSRR